MWKRWRSTVAAGSRRAGGAVTLRWSWAPPPRQPMWREIHGGPSETGVSPILSVCAQRPNSTGMDHPSKCQCARSNNPDEEQEMKVAFALTVGLALIAASAEAHNVEGTLHTIQRTKTIRLGYLEMGVPFSFAGRYGKPEGYSVELCLRVAEGIRQQLGLGRLEVRWLPVTAENRFEMVKDGAIDLECGASTNTLSRQKVVDFSLPTWVDGSTFLTRVGSGIGRLSDLAGKKVAVIGDTTTEVALDELHRRGVAASIVRVANQVQGINALAAGAVDAYAGNQASLLVLMIESGNGSRFALSQDFLAYEPYGLVMRRDDGDFRQAVDQALARLYRSGEVVQIYEHWFRSFTTPSAAITAMWAINGLPE